MRAILLLTLLLLHPFSIASACRGPLRSFKENLTHASAVFVGRITAVRKLDRPDPGRVGELVEIDFSVERWWKGGMDKTIAISASTDSCGFARDGLRIGEKWLILAGGKPELGTWLLAGNVQLEFEENHPTEDKIPELLISELGKGVIPK